MTAEAKCRYEGLWLREPEQFLQNALPRAETNLDRYSPPPPTPLPQGEGKDKTCRPALNRTLVGQTD